MSTIAAGTTTTNALVSTGNTDGTLQFQVNGTTPSVTLNTLGAVGVGSSPSYGTSGQVLTSTGSTSAPTWATPTGAGSGGSTASGNVTLTSASSGAQSITTTTYGQYVKLPDATTMTKAACVFNITNAGGYPLKIQNSAGTTKGFVPPYGSVTVGLADSSTAAGVWVLAGSTPVAIIGSYSYATTITEGTSVLTKIDSDRDLVLYGTASSGCYGIVFNRTTQSWGSPTLIRSSCPAGQVAAIKTATDQVLVASSVTTAMQAVVLTLSGTTITVGTAATATLSSGVSKMSNAQQNDSQLSFIAVGSSYVLSYVVSTGTIPQLRAMTISGTTVTIGSATVQSGILAQAQLFAVSSSVVLSITCTTGGGIIYATPYTISGTTITAGTGATVSAIGTMPKAVALGSRWALLTTDSSNFFVGSIISVSGTTATASTATLNATAVQAPLGWCVVGSKVVGAAVGASAGDPSKCHIVSFSDNAGTISYGTSLVISTVNTLTTPCLIAATSTTAAMNVRVSGAKIYQWTVDVSATSPTASIRNFANGVVSSVENRAINPYGSSNLATTVLIGANASPDPTSDSTYSGQYTFYQTWGAAGLQNQPTLNTAISGYTAVSTDGSYLFGANCYSSTVMAMWFIEAAQ